MNRAPKGPNFFGAGREIRTPDLRFTKPLLYQLSYTGYIKIVAAIPDCAFWGQFT